MDTPEIIHVVRTNVEWDGKDGSCEAGFFGAWRDVDVACAAIENEHPGGEWIISQSFYIVDSATIRGARVVYRVDRLEVADAS